ncbi:LytTR family DNA-binding domain-containing protein [Aquimarina hainanensis]|uniref:LytTR family DNA-binding domain-containing protein n=1 Tax=Aquimarina hainanensis TaxID=1578017 RepID=A0ABW5NA27_9FLAO
MLKRILFFLNETHYRPQKAYNITKSAFFSFVISYFFLIIFKPFNLNGYDVGLQLVVIFLYSFCASFSFLLAAFILKPTKKERWTYLSEILIVVLSQFFTLMYTYIITIQFLDYILIDLFGFKKKFVVPSFFFIKSMMYITVTGWILYVLLNFYSQMKYNLKKRNKKTMTTTHHFLRNSKMIFLVGKNKGEQLYVSPFDLISIHCQGHYIKVFYYDSKKIIVQKEVFRLSMREVEEMLFNHTNIIRCHKSFFVNTAYIKSIKAKGNGWVAILNYNNMQVAVSKDKLELVKQQINMR